MQVLLGADPEVFYREGGELMSAFGLIPGDKENPYPVDNGAVQVDGMALEFNITPASSSEEWVFNLQSVMAQLQEMVAGELEVVPVAEFGAEYIKSQPEKAKELGCDPDFNAYTGEPNPEPNSEASFRTGAGHLHIGWTEGADEGGMAHVSVCESIVKLLDIRLGLVSLLLDPCDKRRELYGRAGAYRSKPYGLEYRVLSNFWLQSVELMEWVYTQAHQCIQDFKDGELLFDRYPEVEDIINSSDVQAARVIIQALNLEVPTNV